MLFPNADSQTCDLLRRAMLAANERDAPGNFPIEAELIAEIIFLRRLNVENAACIRVLAAMQMDDRRQDDVLLRRAIQHADRVSGDWDLAPVIAAPEEESHVSAFECFGEVA